MPTEFLPPDPHADATARRPAFVPPNTVAPAPRGERSRRPGLALGIGSGALAVLVLTGGTVFFLTLPASIAGWVLGVRAKRADERPDQANVAVVIGVVGTVLAVAAGIVWIVLLTQTDWTTRHTVGGGNHDDKGLRFDVVRLLVATLI